MPEEHTRYIQAVVDLLKEVLGSRSHPHLFDDLLVEGGSLVLKLTAPCLGQRIAALQDMI